MSKRLSTCVRCPEKWHDGPGCLLATPGDSSAQAKELHFFDDETKAWPKPDLNTLHCHFQDAGPDQLWGEATPISLYWDPAAERIWHYNSEMRLIVILRNPIERAYSHWSMEHRRGNDPLSFELALKQEEARCREALPFSTEFLLSTVAFTVPARAAALLRRSK